MRESEPGCSCRSYLDTSFCDGPAAGFVASSKQPNLASLPVEHCERLHCRPCTCADVSGSSRCCTSFNGHATRHSPGESWTRQLPSLRGVIWAVAQALCARNHSGSCFVRTTNPSDRQMSAANILRQTQDRRNQQHGNIRLAWPSLSSSSGVFGLGIMYKPPSNLALPRSSFDTKIKHSNDCRPS